METLSLSNKKYYLKSDKKAFFYPEDYIKLTNMLSERQLFTIKCLINTGARINEIRNVIGKDLDVERCSLNLRITKVRAKLGEVRPNPRIIALSTDFTRYFRLNINKYKFLSTDRTGAILQLYSKKIEVKNWKDFSAHNLRKTFGTWMLALGVDGFKLAQHLGHSPDMLRTHYASPDIFSYKDKDIMREVLGDLPTRLRN